MLGVFSATDKGARRSLIRNETKGDWPKELVEFKFIFGRPATLELARMLSKEQEEFGDIVIVGCEENIDTGESWGAIAKGRWKEEGREGARSRRARPFVSSPLLVLHAQSSPYTSLFPLMQVKLTPTSNG